MKKLIALLVIIMCAGISGIKAQDFEDQNFKPETGSWGAEVNFAPFSSSPISLNYLRFRNFTSDNSAFRLGIFVGVNVENPDEDLRNQTFEFSIRPGVEKHFEGSRRLSPYIGGELDIAFKLSKSTFNDGEGAVKGAWANNGQERGFNRLGANAIAGVDFYITKGLYLGTEFGFGLEYIKQADIVFENNGVELSETKGGSTFQLGPNVNSAIRLGFNF